MARQITRQIKEPTMSLETYKINIRAYFPDVVFLEDDGNVECVHVDGDWLHTLLWKDGKAYFAISNTVISEKTLVKFLKHLSTTHQQYDASKIALPIDTYEDRGVRLIHTLCNKVREEIKK